MSPEPKGNQKKLIGKKEGLYLVDAGAGTGKTFTVSRRYAELLDNGVNPNEIFLATFTENAAENMREEIINYCDHDLSELRDAPIATFHGFCQQLLLKDGFAAPAFLGLEDHLTENTRTVANEVQEKERFSGFYGMFRDEHREYEDFARIVYDEHNLLDLIKSLAAKGIFPEKDGWYRDGRSKLLGDYEKYIEALRAVNKPLSGKNGKKQSRLLGFLNGMREKTFDSAEISSKYDIKDGKRVDPEVMERAFREDRDGLIDFIHDIYFGYLDYALGQNFLNFSFQLMFAFVLLMENHELREANQFEYVMIDEFQDTNEIQFKLSLLLSRTGNILAVGDWKQSIFGFQYAAVKNITDFQDRYNRYLGEINSDKRRVPFGPEEVNKIALRRNYRSSQAILDFSQEALYVKGNRKEKVDPDQDVVSLRAAEEKYNTEIAGFVSEEEIDAVLEQLERVVGNREYCIYRESEPGSKVEEREVEYRDVAIFSRNRSFARQLDKRARELGIPVTYEGGVELFKTDPGILLLAWLRVLKRKSSRRGWSVILDEAGYNIAEIEYILDNKDYPPEALEFVEALEATYDIAELARKVFTRYGMDNGFTDAIIQVLQETFETSYMNLGAMINFIENNIEMDATYEVDGDSEEAATVQTIHAAKGLEYPVVFLANMNRGVFPSRNSGRGSIFYDDTIGLRARKIYSEEDEFTYDNLEEYLAARVTGRGYDEERRLLYVALTRAENYLFLSAEAGREGRFFRELDIQPEKLEPNPEEIKGKNTGQRKKKLSVAEPDEKRPIKRAVTDVTSSAGAGQEGRGAEFGTMIHRFAERLVRNDDLEPPFTGRGREDKERLYDFISSLEGELTPEQDVLVPKKEGADKVVYHGSIDLLHVLEGRVEVIDYKTDFDRSSEDEYRKQLSLYRQAVAATFPEKEVVAELFYTYTGEVVKL